MKEISNYSYTWKSEYILPYESQWSIRAKFCYLNGESYINFAKINKEKKSANYHMCKLSPMNSSTMDMDITRRKMAVLRRVWQKTQ